MSHKEELLRSLGFKAPSRGLRGLFRGFGVPCGFGFDFRV